LIAGRRRAEASANPPCLDDFSAEELIRDADVTMYKAKTTGKGQAARRHSGGRHVARDG
jgi:hypothetical protein